MDKRLLRFLTETVAATATVCAGLAGEFIRGARGQPSICISPEALDRVLSAEARAQELLKAIDDELADTGPAEDALDARCPASVRLSLRGIAEQTDKRQYWNAAWRTYELLGDLLKAFGRCLSEKPDYFGHEPPSRKPARSD